MFVKENPDRKKKKKKDVNKVCFEGEQDTPNTPEKSRKGQSITEWCKCGK